MAENESMIGGGLGEGNTNPRGAMRAAKVKFPIDSRAVKDLNAEFSTLKDSLASIKKTLQDIARLGPTALSGLSISGEPGTGTGTANRYALRTVERPQTGTSVAETARNISQRVSNNATSSASGSGGSGFLARAFGAIGGGGGGGGLSNAIGAIGGGGGGGGLSNILGAIGGGGGGGGLNIGSMIMKPLTDIASSIGKSLDARIERGYDYSLSADRMNVLYQQTTGMSQNQVVHAYRQPLANYRLGGADQVNAMLEMQAATGLSAQNQASSVEALRAASGYSYGARDITKMISTLGTAEVNNRMFMTMGGGLYGIGGKENTAMDVVQRIVKASGLTNEKTLKGALRQGSMTRANLSFMGVPEDMQDLVIQYAQENLQYKNKGGQGMYDPSRMKDRRLMGIEENFSTQKEVSERLNTKREEDFYKRQADNFATLERVTQTLTRTLNQFEEWMSGIIGMKVSSGPLGKMGGTALSTLGAGAMALAPLTGPAAPFVFAGGAIASLLGGFFGDPIETGRGDPKPKTSSGSASGTTSGSTDNLQVPAWGSGGKITKTTIGKLKTRPSFAKLHPSMKDRLIKMMVAAGGRVGVGEGVRDSSAQERMFRERYEPTSEKTDIFWNGTYWKHVRGAAAAPPGMSMHEIGLAADLVGDMGWIVQNASRFNLRSFHDVNNEPWHVQPSELPGSRKKYEDAGSPWGNGPAGAYKPNPNDTTGATPTEDVHDAGHNRSSTVETYTGMSIGQIIRTQSSENLSSLVSGVGASGEATGAGGLDYSVGSNTPTKKLTGVLSGSQIVGIMKTAGFTGQDLIKAVGISYRESRWDPTVYNGKENDRSYGLFQLNMKDAMGPDRRRRFGISRNEELFDPAINARSAHLMTEDYRKEGKNPWYPWGPYKGRSETFNVDMAAAAATVRAAGSGDPIFPEIRTREIHAPRSGGNETHITNGGNTITISPVINLTTSGNIDMDIRRIAKEVGNLISKEVDLTLMRRT